MQENHAATSDRTAAAHGHETWYRPLRAVETLLDDLLADVAPAPAPGGPEPAREAPDP